jgi:group II intron reverse transcriptase/maturase
VLYRSAKQDPQRRFHALFDKVARSDVMWRAWCDVAANRGAPGVDGVSIADVEAGGVESVRAFLDELAEAVRSGSYRPAPLRRVHIPKPGRPGQTRPLGIPTVGDRVVMAAAKIVLEPVFEADFDPVSFGFRPKRSAQQALEAVRVGGNRGRVWVLDADIKACFDTIDHDALIAQVQRRVVDRRMIKLLRGWLRAGVFEGGIVSQVEAGSPQGSPISPLLANIALHVLDEAWRQDGQRLGQLVRYCDDFVVLCPTRAARAASALGQDQDRLPAQRGAGLRLPRLPSPDGGVEQASWPVLDEQVALGEGHVVHPGKDPWPDFTTKGRVTAERSSRRTQPRLTGMGCLLPPRELLGEVRCDRLLRPRTGRHPGQQETPTLGVQLDRPIHPVLAGRPRNPPTPRDGPLPGCACLTVNGVGEPCAGEPHARFDGRGLARGNLRHRPVLDPTD